MYFTSEVLMILLVPSRLLFWRTHYQHSPSSVTLPGLVCSDN